MVNLSREADNLGIKQIAAKHEKDLLSRNILLPEQHKLLLSLEQNSIFFCFCFNICENTGDNSICTVVFRSLLHP
jgi:hypothetical protein